MTPEIQAAVERLAYAASYLPVAADEQYQADLALLAAAADAREGADDLRTFRFHAPCPPITVPDWTQEQWDAWWERYWRDY